MKDYKKIVVFENDMKELSYLTNKVINKETVPVEPWFNFNYSFYHNKEENFKRLTEISANKSILIVTNPSFVGADNQFTGYLSLFLKMKDMGIKLDVAVIYHENFYMYLLKFLAGDGGMSYLKKESNHALLKEVLDYHNIYEIDNQEGSLKNVKHLTYEFLMENYVEAHRKLERTKFKIKGTNEIYPAASVYYGDNLANTEIRLYIEEKPNNNYTFDQLERV